MTDAMPAMPMAPQQHASMGPTAPTAALFVGNLHPAVTEQELFSAFKEAGNVVSVKIARDNVTRESRGHGYVNFMTHADAASALDSLNYELLHGQRIRVMQAERDPARRRNNAANVFIKGLAQDITERDLYELCNDTGPVVSVKVRKDSEGKSLGFAYVQFAREEHAKQLVEDLNEAVVEGKQVSVEMYRPRQERKTANWTNVYVKDMPREWNDEKLKAEFSQFGELTSVCVPMDEQKQTNRGFGFANFASHEDAKKAVAGMHGKEHLITLEVTEDGQTKTVQKSKPLYVARAQTKQERGRLLAEQREQFRRERTKKMQECNLHVANLSDDVTEEKLNEVFSKFGAVTSACVMQRDGKSAGFGFVCFDAPEAAAKALQDMQGSVVGKQPIKVNMWQPKAMREANKIRTNAFPVANNFPFGPVSTMQRMPGMFNIPQGGMMHTMAANYGMMPGMPERGGMRGVPMDRAAMQMMQARQYPMMMMQQQMQGQPMQAAVQPASYASAAAGQTSATLYDRLKGLSVEDQKSQLGVELYNKLSATEMSKDAPRITGILLGSMDVPELLDLLENQEKLQTNAQDVWKSLGAQA